MIAWISIPVMGWHGSLFRGCQAKNKPFSASSICRFQRRVTGLLGGVG